MENVAWLPRARISSQYDLKGSWVARQVLKDSSATRRKLSTGCKGQEGTLKDLDMPFEISFPGHNQIRSLLIRDLQRDVNFLEKNNIMDYSLFIAFHYHELSDTTGSEDVLSNPLDKLLSRPSTEDTLHADSFKFHRGLDGGCLVQLDSCEWPPFCRMRRPDGSRVHVQSQSSLKPRSTPLDTFIDGEKKSMSANRRSRDSRSLDGIDSTANTPNLNRMSYMPQFSLQATMFLGIIDFLQVWNLQKQSERSWKVFVQRVDSDGVSAIEPSAYARRFMSMVENTFKE